MTRSRHSSAPVDRRGTSAASSKGEGFLTEKAAAAAIGKYIKAHPKTYRVTVAVKGAKVVVQRAGALHSAKKKPTLKLPPPGYFAEFYCAVDAAEDNRLAGASVIFDPADFRE